jgi:hypothetical protein
MLTAMIQMGEIDLNAEYQRGEPSRLEDSSLDSTAPFLR